MYSLSVLFIKLFSSLENVRGIYIYLLFLDPEWKIFTVCHLKTWELHMFCFVSVLTVEKEKLIGLVSHQISVVTYDEVTPDLRSDFWWSHTRSQEWRNYWLSDSVIKCKTDNFLQSESAKSWPTDPRNFCYENYCILSTITMDRLSISKFQIFHIYGEWTRLMIYQSCQINNFLFAKLLQHLFLIQSIRLVCNESPIFRDNLHYHHHFIHSFQEITQSSSSCVIKFQVQRKIFHKRRLSNIHVGKMKMSRYLEPGKIQTFLQNILSGGETDQVSGDMMDFNRKTSTVFLRSVTRWQLHRFANVKKLHYRSEQNTEWQHVMHHGCVPHVRTLLVNNWKFWVLPEYSLQLTENIK